MDCAVDGDGIVDFCSGGGHLGIVSAHLLPRCRVIMVDNKEESVCLARRRAVQLALPNMELIQSNLDYLRRPATDLVSRNEPRLSRVLAVTVTWPLTSPSLPNLDIDLSASSCELATALQM
jgi:hypothetical protein